MKPGARRCPPRNELLIERGDGIGSHHRNHTRWRPGRPRIAPSAASAVPAGSGMTEEDCHAFNLRSWFCCSSECLRPEGRRRAARRAGAPAWDPWSDGGRPALRAVDSCSRMTGDAPRARLATRSVATDVKAGLCRSHDPAWSQQPGGRLQASARKSRTRRGRTTTATRPRPRSGCRMGCVSGPRQCRARAGGPPGRYR